MSEEPQKVVVPDKIDPAVVKKVMTDREPDDDEKMLRLQGFLAWWGVEAS